MAPPLTKWVNNVNCTAFSSQLLLVVPPLLVLLPATVLKNRNTESSSGSEVVQLMKLPRHS